MDSPRLEELVKNDGVRSRPYLLIVAKEK